MILLLYGLSVCTHTYAHTHEYSVIFPMLSSRCWLYGSSRQSTVLLRFTSRLWSCFDCIFPLSFCLSFTHVAFSLLYRKGTAGVCSVLYLPPDLCLLSKGWHFHWGWCRFPLGNTYAESLRQAFGGAKWHHCQSTQALESSSLDESRRCK